MPEWLSGEAVPYWVGAGAALVVAVLAGVGEWRRKRRDDLDRVAPVDWATLQMLALIVATVLVVIAVHD